MENTMFKVGDRVKHLVNNTLGIGTVVKVEQQDPTPVKVDFTDLDIIMSYTHEGKRKHSDVVYIRLIPPLEELL